MKWLWRVGLILFLLGFLVMIYSPMHDALGLHGIQSFVPGYEQYHAFGPYNWMVVEGGTGVLVPGIICMLTAWVVTRWRSRKRMQPEEIETTSETNIEDIETVKAQ